MEIDQILDACSFGEPNQIIEYLEELKAKLQAYEDNKEIQFSGTARMCYQKNTDFFAGRILDECDHEETFKVIIFKDKK